MILFRNSTLREAILRKKGAIQDIETRLAATATGWALVKGQWARFTPGSRQRLIEDKAHLELQVRELEVEELLQAWHASSKDPESRAAIDKQLADRGVTLRKPPTPLAALLSRRQHHPPDARKELIAQLKARHEKASARRICELIDKRIDTTPAYKHCLLPLESWLRQAPGTRSWIDVYERPETHDLVRSYVNKVPRLKTAKSSK